MPSWPPGRICIGWGLGLHPEGGGQRPLHLPALLASDSVCIRGVGVHNLLTVTQAVAENLYYQS